MSAGITGFSLQTLKKNPCKHLKCSNHFSRDHDAVLVALSAVDLFYSSQSYGIDFSSLSNPQRKTRIEWKLHQCSPKQTNFVVFTCIKVLEMSYIYIYCLKMPNSDSNLTALTKFTLITPLAYYCLILPIKLSDFTFLTVDWLLLIFEVQRKVEWVFSKSFCKTQLGHS